MFQLTDTSKIYIAAPAGAVSGGPELLHQLCHALCALGRDAWMIYPDATPGKQPCPERYRRYATHTAAKIEDAPQNLLIAPEANLTYCLQAPQRIQKCVWWLAANNFYWCRPILRARAIEIPRNAAMLVKHALERKPLPLTMGQIKRLNATHLAQCWYTVAVLQQQGVHNVAYLSDYIGDEFLAFSAGVLAKNPVRENLLIYNGSRYQPVLQHLMQKMPDTRFVAIKGMGQDEIRALMSRAKIYIDFGVHPGKDRLPREAALCGCCVLVGSYGGADLYNDMPIPSAYKFPRNDRSIPAAAARIREILADYPTHAADFAEYRAFIQGEKGQFEQDVKRLFG